MSSKVPVLIDVDDWPKYVKVGDVVWYRLKKQKVIAKYSDRWHADKPTFALEFNEQITYV